MPAIAARRRLCTVLRTLRPAPHRANRQTPDHDRRHTMKWETPTATDMRFGFEITMYIANR